MSEITYKASKTLSAFHRSEEFVRGAMGPIGSGKSVACCWEVFAKAQVQRPGPDGVRRSRWAIIRNTYRELLDTTVQTWCDWFPKELGTWRAQDMMHIIESPLEDGTSVRLEVLFRALDRPDDVKKLLSLELTGAWVNEAREVPKAVIDMLQGRVGRYPSKRDGGASWFGVIMDTNPPDDDHWWFRLFEEVRPEGWALFKQPSGTSEEAENIDNLPPGYYTRMMAGKDPEWIKVYVHGQYGFVQDGKPVFPEFTDSVHVADSPVEPNPGLPIVVGIDFGLTPAAVFLQKTAMRWVALHEVVAEDMGAVRFSEVLSADMRSRFPHYEFQIWGDPAGDQRSQATEETPFQILRANQIPAMPAPSNDFTLRRESVARPLLQLALDGKPGFLLSPTCKMLRKGMNGGYRYKRIQVSGDERYQDKPDKGIYSHVCDALQYALLGGGEGVAVITPHHPTNNQPVQYKANFKIF